MNSVVAVRNIIATTVLQNGKVIQMKYIIDIPNEMVIKSALNGLTLGIAMIETSTQKQFIIPTNIPLIPYIEPQKWIPCSEELPKNGISVLFCDDEGDIYNGYCLVRDGGRYHMWMECHNADRIKNVVAWMYWPEPWKEAKE